MDIFYHASDIDYEIGQVYTSNIFQGGSSFYYNNLDCNNKLTEIWLERFKPKGYISRNNAFFLFAEKRQCGLYAKTLKRKEVKIYEVMPMSEVFGGFPLCLVNKINKYVDERIKEKIIREYWSPKKEWKMKEYITQSIKVLSLSGLEYLCMDFEYDQDLFQTFIKTERDQ